MHSAIFSTAAILALLPLSSAWAVTFFANAGCPENTGVTIAGSGTTTCRSISVAHSLSFSEGEGTAFLSACTDTQCGQAGGTCETFNTVTCVNGNFQSWEVFAM